MHGPDGSSLDRPAERRADALMPEAHAQNGHAFAEPLHGLDRNSGLHGRSGTGRDDDRIRLHTLELLEAGVVAHHYGLNPLRAESLREVVNEGIEVIYEE